MTPDNDAAKPATDILDRAEQAAKDITANCQNLISWEMLKPIIAHRFADCADAAELERARASIRSQQAIIDKLPKTADGVPIVPGMVVWKPNSSWKVRTIHWSGKLVLDTPDTLGSLEGDRGENVYFTREAALAAQQEAKP